MEEFKLKSERIIAIRDRVLGKVPSVSIERARYYTQAYQEYEAQPVYLKRARALQRTLQNMTIFIAEHDLLAGNQSEEERCAPIFPEYAVEWIIDELAEKGNFDKREGDNFHLKEEDRAELLDIADYWMGKTLKDRSMAIMTDELKQASLVKAIHGEGNMTSGDGHIVPDFPKALKVGLRGIIEETKERLAKVDISEDDGFRQKAFLESVILVNESIIAFADRYSILAREMAQSEKDEARKEELLRIAKSCSKVPGQPCETFEEAVQAIWFMHLVIQIESNGHSASLGRLDQYLYPYYRKDLEEGTLDSEQAKELLQNLWAKLYSVIKIRPTSHAGYGAGYPTYQNVTIGGSSPTGTDETNALSYLILESVGEMKLTQPNLSARLHSGTREKFLRKCAEVIRSGFGMPALHTDEAVVPALLNKGVSYQDAYNYTMVGCVEVAVPGKWGYRCTGMTFLNLVKVLELTLNDGYDRRSGIQLYGGNGSLEDFATYGSLFEALRKNIAWYTKLTVAMDKVADTGLLEFPDIFCSSLTDDCITRAKTVKEGGAVYDIISGLQVGISNVANSMEALKKLVYEEGRLTLKEVKTALETNFDGLEGQRTRKLLLSAPKYGNDIEEVDAIASEVYGLYSEEIGKYRNSRYGKGPIGGVYGLSTSGISSNVPMGIVTGATPDGRYAYTPAAEGGSPVQGTDLKGPTAVLKSVMKLPTILLTGGQLLNVKFSPDLLSGEVQFTKFLSFLRSFIALKGWHIQFNVISRELLLEAQKEPEKHRDMIVRVAGYCAQFITLDPTTQDDIISRTEQKF